MSEHQNYVCCTKANGIVSNHICQLTHPFTKIDTSVDIGCKPIHHSCVFLFGQNIWEILEDFFSNGNSTNCFFGNICQNF